MPRQRLTSLPVARGSGSLISLFLPALAAAQIVHKDDSLGNLLDRLAALPALLLQSEISRFLIHVQLALQDSLGALHDLARLQLPGKLRFLKLHARQLHLSADEVAKHGDQANLL